MTRYRAFAALACAVTVAACDKDAVQQIAGPTNGSFVKFFNFGVGSPSVNFWADSTKVTATSSAAGIELPTGVAYGGAGNGGLYNTIAPGDHRLTGRLSDTATANRNVVVSSITTPLVSGKAYSFYQSGIYNTTTRTVDAFIIEDPIPARVSGDSAYVRFVHAVSNGGPLTLYATRDTTGAVEFAIGSEIAYKAGTAFVPIRPGAYTLRARLNGVTTNLITRTGVAFSGGRVYTITARGNVNTTSTLALDNTANR